MIDQLPVLYVEDDPVDLMSLRRAFRQCGVNNRLYNAAHGEAALALLHAATAREAPPGLILLDLNMPVMSGLEFLAIQKSDAELRRIPTVVLTSSSQESDRRRSYELGAAGFVAKPIEFEAFVRVVETIDRYWKLCECP